MITLDQALIILQDTINGLRHPDYDHVVQLSEWYRKVITGKDIDTLLRQFVRREDATMFEQRKNLTVAITPAVSETLINPFYRVGRLDNIKKDISFPDGSNGERRVEEINTRVGSFWGRDSLDKYMASRFIQYVATDPNAWLVVEFNSFDSRYEKARPYPVEFNSAEAINFSVVNNDTEWLIVKRSYTKEVNKVKKDYAVYTMYLPNDILQYTQVLEGEYQNSLYIFNDEAGIINPYWQGQGEKYILTTYQPKGGEVQAVRFGYKPDMTTNGRTYVNPFHAAKPYFEKTIKAVSEMDLTMALHAFSQKVQRVQQCPGTIEERCNKGQTVNGTCTVCLGTGEQQVHTSAQDVITLPMPKKGDTDYVKIEDMIKYFTPDVTLLEFQNKYISELEVKAIAAVYNSDVLAKKSIAQTATERIENKDEMYNTLQPFAEHYSSVWRKVVRLIASFTDNSNGLQVVHEFPSDFKLKTINEMMADRKLAEEAGAPAYFIQQLDKDIAAKMLADDETAYKKFIVKSRFTPFLGKSDTELKDFWGQGKYRPEDYVLYWYSDTIFDELEMDTPGFFDFTYQKQVPIVNAKIAGILTGLPKELAAIDFRDTEVIDTPTDVEAEAKANLKGSVGGVQGILSIQESVAKGVTQYEAAVALLGKIYGFSDADAREMLGNPTALQAANTTQPVTV